MTSLTRSYLRPLLATLLVLASLTVLSQEAHCLGMTLEADLGHSSYHAAHGEQHGAPGSHEKHNCDHESNIAAQGAWAAMHQPNAASPVPMQGAMKLHWSIALPMAPATPPHMASKSTAPPRVTAATTTHDVLSRSGRLLI